MVNMDAFFRFSSHFPVRVPGVRPESATQFLRFAVICIVGHICPLTVLLKVSVPAAVSLVRCDLIGSGEDFDLRCRIRLGWRFSKQGLGEGLPGGRAPPFQARQIIGREIGLLHFCRIRGPSRQVARSIISSRWRMRPNAATGCNATWPRLAACYG